MPNWLKQLLTVLYLILGGIIGGAASSTTLSLSGCCQPAPAPTPPVPPAPTNPVDPVNATVKFYMGGVGCTATILEHRPAPGKYWILCAAHCVRGGPGNGQVKLNDGRVLNWRLVNVNAQADISLLIADGPDGLPVARIAKSEPGQGTQIWHKGFGVDRPGNREDGTIVDGPDGNGQLRMRLNVSSGDSGSGIFRTDTGEIVSVVCCGNNQFTWGSGPTAINRLVAGSVDRADELPPWNPHPISKRDKDGKHATGK